MSLTQIAANRKDVSTARYGVKLQHRHFSFIAATIANIVNSQQRNEIARLFADACATTNPHFDYGRFLAACKLS